MIEDLVGLHGTDPRSPYLQLNARVGGFRPEQLDELLEDGRAAKVPGMRGTLFVQTRELIPIVYAATRARLARSHEKYLAQNGLTLRDYRRLAGRVADVLAAGALDARQLREALHTRAALPAVLHVMCDEMRVVRWKGPAGWRSAGQTYRLFEEAVPALDVESWEERPAVGELVRRYIRSYGPVSTADIAWWTGLPKAAVAGALERLAPEIVSVDVEGAGDELLMHSADRRRLRSQPGSSTEVALLPILDPYLQGYRDRDRYVDRAHEQYVFDPKGNSTSTILVDGRVAGVWDLVEDDEPELRVFFLDRPSPPLRNRVFSAAADVASFLGHDAATVVEVGAMTPLTKRTGWVVSPLR